MGLAGLLLILDQGTKALIRESLALGARIDLTSFFALVHAENRAPPSPSLPGLWLAALVSWRWLGFHLGCSGSSSPAERRALALTYGALLGGALGNALDRAASGAVQTFCFFIGKTITFPHLMWQIARLRSRRCPYAPVVRDGHNTPAEDS